jgi:hypothetical protein
MHITTSGLLVVGGGVLLIFLPGLASNRDPPISASQVAEIIEAHLFKVVYKKAG